MSKGERNPNRLGPTAISLVVLLLLATPPMAAAGQGAPDNDPAAARDFTPWWDENWQYRRPVTVTSQAAAGIPGYQLFIRVNWTADMRSDFSDLRFVQFNASSSQNEKLKYWTEYRTDGVSASVWVRLGELSAGTNAFHMYFGNAGAASESSVEGIFDFHDDFSGNSIDTSKWSVDDASGWSVANGELRGTTTTGVLHSKVYLFSGCIAETRTRGASYAGNSHNPLSAWASTSDLLGDYWGYSSGGWAFYSFYADGFPSANYNWKSADSKVIYQLVMGPDNQNDFVKRDYDTYAFKEAWSDTHQKLSKTISGDERLRLGRRCDDGYRSQGYDAYWDWVRLRKYVSPEPVITFGDKEYPFRFVSATVSHDSANERDTVLLNITFNNPTSIPILINVSFWVGEDLAEADRLGTREVTLAPGRDTVVQEPWTAVGGDTVLWVAMGSSVLASFPISVNWYPKLDSIPDQQLLQDQPYVLKFTAKDKGGDALSWKEDSPLFNFSKTNSTGAEAQIKPSNDQVGSYTVNITVTDTHGCSDNRTFRITVENQNDPPWLEYIPGLVAYEDAKYSYRVNATDPDLKWGDSLTFSDDCGLFDIDPKNGSLSFTPTNAQVGKYYIEISVRDNQSATSTRTFNLSVQNTNDPPVIEPIPPQTATQGKLWQVMAHASDIDQSTPAGDRLRFSDDSPLFDINAESGLVTFTPGNGHVGQWACNITATDTAGASSSTRLELAVLNVNDPPAMESIPDQTATEEVAFEYTVKASDPDVPLKLDNLTFSDDTQLFDIDPRTGTFSFVPTNAQVGKHTIRITVKDESGASAGRTFTLTVVNVNDAPYNVSITSLLPGAKYREGQDLWLNGTGSDEDAGDRLTFVWFDNDVEVGRGKSVQVKLGPGEHRITLKVSDGTAEAASEVSIRVSKAQKEQVTVQGDWWIPLAIVVIAAAGVGGALVAMKRSKRKDDEREVGSGKRTDEGRKSTTATSSQSPPSSPSLSAPAAGVASVGAAAAGAAAAAPPVKPGDKDKRDKARKALDAAEDAVADALESGADTAAAEESLDIARDFFKDGDYDEAVTYANEAKASLKPEEKPRPDVGKLACPECGEDLQPEWPACPVCGHKTR